MVSKNVGPVIPVPALSFALMLCACPSEVDDTTTENDIGVVELTADQICPEPRL